VDREGFLERVREVLPGIRERAARTESLRRLPDETWKELRALGLLRALQPRAAGGHELDVLTLYEAVALVADACPSTGWVFGVLGVHPWQLALFPERAQDEVWGPDPDAQVSSSYAPTGTVEPVSDGFRLRGRWSFSSGCDHCDWVFLGGVAGARDGLPDFRTFLLPRSDYTIVDNWRVAGLAGTGSKDIAIEDAFVPDYRTHSLLDAYHFRSPGQQRNAGPLYRLPFGCVFACGICAPAIGAARGAIDAFRADMRERISRYNGRPVAEEPTTQVRIAEAAAEVDAAWAALRRNWEEMGARVARGEPLSLELRTRTRRDAADGVRRSVRAIDLMFEASGGRGLFLDQPLQRYWRDAHAMRAHAMNNPERAARLFGSLELRPDQPPGDFFL
jgi:3-hydroxy-9,10-secoandrosta-1,3,5(10)-triene-9,17-dione monooxygenase